MAVDVQTLALELSTAGLARGERDASAILSRLEQRLDKTVQRAQAINKAINDALKFGSGGSGKSAASNLASDLDRTAAAQKRAADEALKHAQALARLKQAQGDTAGAIRTLEGSLNGFAGSSRQALAAQTQLARLNASQHWTRYASTVREAGESIQQTGYFLTGLSTGLISVGAAAVKSAFDIDKNVNTLKAFLGSTDAAEARLKQLTSLSQRTPGLTTSLAATLDAQLRTTNVSQSTIDKILPSIGRLNAVSPLGDPQKFAQNLNQLITQNFERTDLKELVGQSPIAGQILQQLFKVDSPTNAKAIRESAKKLGITTADEFFAAFAKAAEDNPALANVTESLETRFQKLQDRIAIALRPLGLSIVKALEPIIEKAVPLIERLSKSFDELSPSAKTAIVTIAGLAAAIGPIVIGIGAFVQAFGAIGNLASVIGGLSGGAGLTAAIGGIGTALGIVAVAVAGLAAAWYTNFAGIRDITADVVNEAKGLFIELHETWAQIIPDLKPIAESGLAGVADAFKFYSGLYGAVWRETWDFVKTTVREALDVIRPGVVGLLSLLRGDFEGFRREFVKVWQETWDFIVTFPARAFSSLVKVVEDGLTSLLTTTGFAQGVGLQIGDSLGKGIVDGFTSIATSPSTSIAIRAFLETVRGNTSQRNTDRQAQREASANRGLDGEEITGAQLSENKAKLFAPKTPKLTGLGSAGTGTKSRAESEARQLRGAEEELARATAKARLEIEENTLRKLIELDKDSFDKRLVSADTYYERLIQNELKLQDIERQRVQAELSASQARSAGAKAGTPEALREKAQQVELEARLSILETERAGTVRKLNDELLKLKVTEKDRNDELLKAGSSFSFDILKKQAENFDAQRVAKRDRPDTNLRIEEARLQGLGNAGLLREQQVTDALILTRRKYRAELIASAEARKADLLATAELEGRFADTSRLDEEIASLQNLGTELTRAEQLQKRFAEQGRIDYSRLNEGVEDLLASQKGLTETFSDFRANLVKDQFDLIDSGVDKLTKRLGVLGSAVGTLLKDLAKLALSKLFQKLLGVNTGGGGGASFGFGGGGGGGQQQGFNPLSLLTGGGGGGGGNFLTGGFAGGNPAQAALGGGGGGSAGGGILQQITGLGGGQGGGLLSKIPIIGKLFGGGGGGGVNNLPIFTQGAGGGPLSQGGGALGGAGGVGSFASLGAGGLLAGGGLLGSLAGGNSQIGKLLGGVGGTLLGGVVGASGLLGGGIAGALPALFSNPITAIVGGALIGGALIARFFADRQFNKFRKEVQKEYQIKVDSKQPGRALFAAEKELGEQMFGKGKFGSKIIDTIRSKKGQELLAQYAEANGQENNPLARKFRDRTELTDITDSRNRFTRRAYGGDVTAGTPVIVGDGGRSELFAPRASGEVFPSIKSFEKQLLIALQASNALGGIFGGAKQKLIAQLATRTEAQSGVALPSEFHAAMKMAMGINVRLVEALNRFESMPPEQVVTTGARKAPTAIAEAVHTSIKQSSAPGLAIKQEVFKGR